MKKRAKDTYKNPQERKKASKRKKSISQRQRLTIAVVCLVVVLLFFNYVRNVISLKIENNRLRKQQIELTEERDRLRAKLKNVDDADYIEEYARKHLKLMNPDEILFIFEEEKNDKDNKEDSAED